MKEKTKEIIKGVKDIGIILISFLAAIIIAIGAIICEIIKMIILLILVKCALFILFNLA